MELHNNGLGSISRNKWKEVMTVQEIESVAVDLDIGGTFTDCYMSYDDKYVMAKSPTTRYDVSVGVMKALADAGSQLNLTVEELLSRCSSVRYSTTISLNCLIERTGPKLGLITTAGSEDVTIIGRCRSWADGRQADEIRNKADVHKPVPLIPRDMIVGIKERIDWSGEVLQPLNRLDVIDKIHKLVDSGAMGFVVCLLNSFLNPKHELEIREIIEELFPDKYLGAMPIILSHEISPVSGEYPRSMTAILNAYMHRDLSDELRSLGDELRRQGYKKPVVCVHSTGAVSKVIKTSALETYASGPIAGLLGGAPVCEKYGISNVIMTDMGGTSFDIAMIVDGKPGFYQYRPVIERFFVSLPILEVATLGAGGGSIAFIDPLSERLKVGPRSAGAMPGPVCYDLGGREPTVTDADLLLGYINPDRFCGGKIKLNKERAEMVMGERIAKPLGMTVVEASAAIKSSVDGTMGNEIFKEIALRGLNPKDFAVFAYGGAGATHAAGYSASMGKNGPIYIFGFSPVFCAFGSAVSDIAHIYQLAKHMVLIEGDTNKVVLDFDEYSRSVDSLIGEAQQDLIEDGFDPETAIYSLELEMHYGSQLQNTIVDAPVFKVDTEADGRSIHDAFTKTYVALWGPGSAYPEGGVEITLFRLKAIIPTGGFNPTPGQLSGSDPSDAERGHRDAYWDGGFLSTPVYDAGCLVPGNVVCGPALVEADRTTIVVPKEWEYRVDQYGTGILGR